MARSSVMIKSSFQITGQHISRKIAANFVVANESPNIDMKTQGAVSYGVSGIIKHNEAPIANAKITAIRNGVVYDISKTDALGKYVLYLEDGVYDIRIESSSYQRVFRNYEIKNAGIKEYKRVVVNGQVLYHNKDVTTFSDSNLNEIKQVSGVIVDEQGKPADEVEIIVANSSTYEIVAFIKTDKSGKYSFVLEGEINYDIVIRSKKKHAKILRNFRFNANEGLIPSMRKSLEFNRDGDWLWISI